VAQFHFVDDYAAHVRRLLARMPRKQAMEQAVGGGFEHIGRIEAQAVRYAGLADGQFLVDLGCGCGRGAHFIGQRMKIEYLGLDIVQDLLDYAAEICPRNYRFVLNRSRTLPLKDRSVDMFCGFSIFTHLLHAESYLYLEEMKRALRPGGRILFSFLEFAEPTHWETFRSTCEAQRNATLPHLNMFIERGAIRTWCEKLELSVLEFIDGPDDRWEQGHSLGQSMVIVEKA
jgi:ubiquinone/menaquinone biosynthesis C-methylase UbiE